MSVKNAGLCSFILFSKGNNDFENLSYALVIVKMTKNYTFSQGFVGGKCVHARCPQRN